MVESSNQFQDLKNIEQGLLRELEKIKQHLDYAQNTGCQLADRLYYLSWCQRHVKKAESILGNFSRMLS